MRSTSILVVVAFMLAITACGTQGMSDQFQRQSLVAASGSLDTTYGTAGLTDVAGRFPNGLVIQRDGKSLILTESGSPFTTFNRTVTLTRLSGNGQPDVTFGLNGAVEVEGMNGALALLCPNGANVYNDWGAVCDNPERPIVVATDVTADDPHQTFLKIYRFLPSGQPDTSFGQNGVLIVPNAFLSYVSTIAVQADGKMLLAGNLLDLNGQAFVARLRRNGTPDPSFGNAGLVLLPLNKNVIKMVLPSNEHPVVLTIDHSQVAPINLYRLTESGLPDTNFGVAGVVSLDFGPYVDASTILAMSNGRLVVGGDGAIWRILANGSPDLTFGVNGQALFPDLGVLSLAFDNQNRLIAGVTTPGATNKATIARFHTNGTLDSGFGIGGFTHLVVVPGALVNNFYQVLVQRNGRILGATVWGYHYPHSFVTMARFLP